MNTCIRCGQVKKTPRAQHCSRRCVMADRHSPERVAERFWSNVDRRSEDECWLWKSYNDGRGYGVFATGGKHWVATRFAWLLTTGTKPNGLVCHRCDVPSCVNPAHLFVGTHTDNVRDAIQKGRMPWQSMTHCKRGHEFTAENTYRLPTDPSRRHCRQCISIRNKMHRARKAALSQTPENRAAILSADQVEAEVARRAGQRRQEAA